MDVNKSVVLILLLAAMLSAPVFGQSEIRYAIDSENSVLRVYVGRAGILARMGHNHVVHTRDISGEIILAENQIDSTASFSFAVNSLIVDEQVERDRAGEGFESQPSASAIEGTRDNMLGEGVLNAAAFPTIAVNVTTESAQENRWALMVELNIQDNSFILEIPAEVAITESTITVDSSFALNHEDIGLSPFSAVGGSLRVAEEIDFELHIEAIANR